MIHSKILEKQLNFLFQIIFLSWFLVQPVYSAPSFLTIADIHYGSDNQLGEDKDTGDEFLKITLAKLQELSKEVNFILVSGDLPTHLSFVTPKKEEYEKAVFHGLYEANGKPETHVLYYRKQ